MRNRMEKREIKVVTWSCRRFPTQKHKHWEDVTQRFPGTRFCHTHHIAPTKEARKGLHLDRCRFLKESHKLT